MPTDATGDVRWARVLTFRFLMATPDGTVRDVVDDVEGVGYRAFWDTLRLRIVRSGA